MLGYASAKKHVGGKSDLALLGVAYIRKQCLVCRCPSPAPLHETSPVAYPQASFHPAMTTPGVPDPQHERWRIEIEAKSIQDGEPATVMKAHQDFLIACRGYARSGICCLDGTPVLQADEGRPSDYIVEGTPKVSLFKDVANQVSRLSRLLLAVVHDLRVHLHQLTRSSADSFCQLFIEYSMMVREGPSLPDTKMVYCAQIRTNYKKDYLSEGLSMKEFPTGEEIRRDFSLFVYAKQLKEPDECKDDIVGISKESAARCVIM